MAERSTTDEGRVFAGRTPAVLALMLLAAAACATRYNFTTAETVLDAQRIAAASRYALGSSDLTDANADVDVRAALDKELAARGWTPVPPTEADVLVGYTLERQSGSSQVTDAFLAPFSTVNADATRELRYLDQTLVIDFVSSATGEDLWRGWAAARFYAPPGEERTEMINQAVASILAQLDD